MGWWGMEQSMSQPRLCFLKCIFIFNWTDHHCIKETKPKLSHPGKRTQNFSSHVFSIDSFHDESWLSGLPMAQIHDCTAAKNQKREDSCMFIFWNIHNLETSLGYADLYRVSSQRSSSTDWVRAQTKMAANNYKFYRFWKRFQAALLPSGLQNSKAAVYNATWCSSMYSFRVLLPNPKNTASLSAQSHTQNRWVWYVLKKIFL